MLGLPDRVRACLFDLDGVLTPTAEIHARAWKQMFDEFLRERARQRGESFQEFRLPGDYDEYVDGKPRLDGVRSFLGSRQIELPEGGTDDPASANTVHGLGTRKNELVLELIERQGVTPYEGSLRYLQRAAAAGLSCAVVSSSANTQSVIESAGIARFFAARVDAQVAEREHLKGKPAPDTFLAAARMLDVAPTQAAVFEDALAGVAAGHAGGFAIVVGVDRAGQAEALRQHGADLVVGDLSELLGAA
jgi:beta-phosphoglucomutase family hydrolase